MAWTTSTRSKRLPGNWRQIRATVKARAGGQCQATHHHPRCPGTGAECDHIIPGDDHSLANLQWLSKECHRAKTAQESAARSRARTRLRPAEKHPGLKG